MSEIDDLKLKINELSKENSRLNSENFTYELERISLSNLSEKAYKNENEAIDDEWRLLINFVFPILDLFISGQIVILPEPRPDLVDMTIEDIMKLRFSTEKGKPFMWDALTRAKEYYRKNNRPDFYLRWQQYQDALKPFGIRIPEGIAARMIDRSKSTVHQYFK